MDGNSFDNLKRLVEREIAEAYAEERGPTFRAGFLAGLEFAARWAGENAEHERDSQGRYTRRVTDIRELEDLAHCIGML